MDEGWRRRLRELALSPLPAFALLSLAMLLLHEPWRDEAQPWMIARDAPNLFREMDSEGTPALWYLLLWPLAKMGLPFLAERLLHVALAVASLGLFVFAAPFSRLERWLFAFGYFVAFEYDVVARSYVLTMLALFALAAAFGTRREHPWRVGILLALLANTTGLGTILAIVATGAFLVDASMARRARPALVVGLVAGAGIVASLLQVRAAPDVGAWRQEWTTRFDAGALAAAAHGVVQAFLPSHDWTSWAWGAADADAVAPDVALVTLAAALWLVSFVPLARSRRATVLWAGCSAGLVALYYAHSRVAGQMRHHGILFVAFVACLWVARVDAPAPRRRGWARAGAVATFAFLVAQVVATPAALATDAQQPFSGGPGIASYMVEHGLVGPRTLVAVYPDFLAPAFLAPLGERQHDALFLQTLEQRSYVRWTQQDYDTFFAPGDVVQKMADAARGKPLDHVLFVVSVPWSSPQLRLLAHVDSLSPGDGMYLYELTCAAACP